MTCGIIGEGFAPTRGEPIPRGEVRPVDKAVVTVDGLRKLYGGKAAVDGISFAVRSGEIFGLLGPNGAGKTTTLECLEGIRRADGGRLEIMGLDPSRGGRLHQAVGVQLQTSGLPAAMKVGEAIALFCAYHGVPPRYDLLARLGLEDKRQAQYSQLSVGLQRRLALALALAHRPPVVILDEPTAGLDVGSRTELHALMREAKEEGTAILLATHDMAEAEKMADRVAILLAGQDRRGRHPARVDGRRRRPDQDLGPDGRIDPVRGRGGIPRGQAAGLQGGLRRLLQHGSRPHGGRDPGPSEGRGRQADRSAGGASVPGGTFPGDHHRR